MFSRRRVLFRLPHSLLALALLVLTACNLYAGEWTKELAPGVVLTQIVKECSGPNDNTIPRIINIVKVDPKAPGIKIKMVLGGDCVWGLDKTKGRETIGSMAKRLRAIAVLNTDFCNWTGDPLGLHISGGELVSEPYPNRTMFGITSDGQYLFDRLEFDARIILPDGRWFPIRGINRPRGDHEMVVYTPKFFKSTCTESNGSEAVVISPDLPIRLGVPLKGTVTCVNPDAGDTPIPENGIVLSGRGTGSDFIKENLKEGVELTLQFNVKGETTTGWEKVIEATGGTPRLVRNGKISLEVEKENLTLDSKFVTVTHPRSALGVTADGKLVLVTVDGRQEVSTGMPLKDLAELMLSIGCVDAMNLDGGGSTTLSTWFGTLNSPSDGWLRPLPNALAVFAEEAEDFDVPEFTISAPSAPIVAGSTVRLSLVDSSGQPIDPKLAEKAIWSMNGVTNFVDQGGVLHAGRVGETEIVVKLDGKIASLPIEVISKATGKLTAELIPDPSGDANKSILNVLVVDAAGKPVQDCMVSVKVTGGASDQPWKNTNADGKASFAITWEEGTSGEVTASVEGLTPFTIKRQ
ncbi:MAG: phosphodiester glycosidase family protein [Armatimonadota bacterium]|nr:phosphodiester glycosidase family protein [Armatimonadota bacterium]